MWLLDFFDGIGRFLAGLLGGLVPLAYLLGAAYITDRLAAWRRNVGRPLAGKWLVIIFLTAASVLYFITLPVRHALVHASCKVSRTYSACVEGENGDSDYDHF